MRSIINICLWAIIVVPAVADAQLTEGKKCATFDRFLTAAPFGVQGKVTAASVRPVLQQSILSPSKKFRIHFDTAGINTPAMVTAAGVRISGTAAQYVDTVARIFDSVWTAEVTTFGFAAPPSDQGDGGGNEYDVYIQDRVVNDFGETVWDNAAPLPGTTAAPKYASYIDIDNDYAAGYRTIGLAALMSTAAHEFHHAIQIGGYGVWYDDLYFYELSAESMEPTVFPYSKDYVKDIGTYFRNIENISLYTALGAYAGYERAIWSIFLMKRYGVGIMRQTWESIAAMKPILAEKTVLEKNNTSLAKEFSEFCYWNYFTGRRADSVRYYADARLFPSVNIREQQTLGNAASVFQYSCKGFGVNYLQVLKGADTAAFIVANVNMDDALGSQSNLYTYQLRASLSAIDGGTQLANGWSTNFSVPDPVNWISTFVLPSAMAATPAVVCYPNPFHPATSPLYIGPIVLASAKEAPQLTVYSASYDGIYSGAVPVRSFSGGTYAVWDGKNSHGDLAASGVYLYMLTAGDSVVKGKFAVVR